MVALLEKALLLNYSLFLVSSYYSKILTKVYLLNGLVLWFLFNIIKNKKRFYRYLIPANPLKKYLFIFLIVAVFSTLLSLSPYHSQKIFLNRYLLYFLSIWLGYSITQRKKNLFILVGAFILGGITVGLGGILDYLRFKPDLLSTSFGRNVDLAFYSVMAIPLNFMVLFFIKNKLLKAGALFALILVLPCFLWNASRTAWIVGIFSTLVIIFLKEKRLALILIIILVISAFLLPQDRKKRVVSIIRTGVLADRPAMWDSAIKIFKDYPVLGAGPGMYEKLFDKYYIAPEAYKGYTYLHCHSTYLELMAEMGIIGLLSFLGIFAVFFKYVFKSVISSSGDRQVIISGLTGTIIAVLILCAMATVIIVGINTAALFWFLFGMAISFL